MARATVLSFETLSELIRQTPGIFAQSLYAFSEFAKRVGKAKRPLAPAGGTRPPGAREQAVDAPRHVVAKGIDMKARVSSLKPTVL
jgi:hypothetical protein